MNVHQLLSGAGPVDAVTNQALAFRARFEEWGWGGSDHAVAIDPRMDGRVTPLARLSAAPEDVLVLHYSAYAPRLRDVLGAPSRKLLISHNVTPAHWFWDHDPATAVRCALGRRHLADFARAVDVAAAVSGFNARELAAAGAGEVRVIPVLVDPTRLGEPGPAPAGPPVILFVGRLTPHKRQEELIRCMGLLARRLPDARLALVGEPLNPRYGRALRELADDVAPGRVSIESSLTAEELAGRYRSASAFVCLSAHEGFCVPVLEAFHFGVPVIARPVGGIPEVAGDAALLVDDDDPAVIAELVALLVEDRELAGELRRRGRARLEHFAPERTAALLREAVQEAAGRAG